MLAQITMTVPEPLFTRTKQLVDLHKAEIGDELAQLLAQMLASADLNGPGVDEDPAVEREMQAYIALHPLLKKSHSGKHVAIYQGKLIDEDEDYDALTRRIDTQYPDHFVWVTTVEEEPIKTYFFRSPRVEPVG